MAWLPARAGREREREIERETGRERVRDCESKRARERGSDIHIHIYICIYEIDTGIAIVTGQNIDLTLDGRQIFPGRLPLTVYFSPYRFSSQ